MQIRLGYNEKDFSKIKFALIQADQLKPRVVEDGMYQYGNGGLLMLTFISPSFFFS